jgi:hypothetical protein
MASQTTETLARTVLYAVELVDPVTGAPVTSGVKVEPLDAAGAPLAGRPPSVNRSGRMVWLQPGSVWPAKIRVTPGNLPFAARTETVAPPLHDPVIVAGQPTPLSPQDRLIRIVLSPTAAYPFEGVAAVRGLLRDTDGGTPLSGAVVQLAWQDAPSHAWRPAPPNLGAPRLSTEAVTDERGEFAAFMPPLPPGADPVVGDASHPQRLKVRLQVTRLAGGVAKTRWTPETAPPLSLPADGLVPDGQVYERAVSLSWDRLSDH